MSEFGNRLRKLRRNADVTQRQLAQYLGVTYAAVGKYECLPNAYPSIEGLIKLADYFHVSTDYLLRGIETAMPSGNNLNGDLNDSTVIQSNRGGTVLNGKQAISSEAEELLSIYNKLNVRERLKLLNLAVELDERRIKND